jgi:RNA polymerase sigma factor (TIGR02999 family)
MTAAIRAIHEPPQIGARLRIDFERRPCEESVVSDLTRVINALRRGDTGECSDLPAMLYSELRAMAASRMRLEAPGQTLQPTALVHEAWLRLFGSEASVPFENRRHFYAAVAEAMRRILVEQARRRSRLKRGGHLERVDIDDVEVAAPFPDDELLALDDAMDRLTTSHPRAAEVVRLCYFAGFTQAEAGDILGVSSRTVERHWAFARAWLFKAIAIAKASGS